MPKLPDINSLDTATPQSSRGIAGYNGTQVGDAMQQLGQTGLRTGAILQREEAQKQEKQDRLEVAYAKSTLLRGQVDAQQKLQDDPDYGSYEKKYLDEVGQTRAQAASMITNPEARQMFEVDADMDITRGRSSILNLARDKEHQYGRASLEETINQNMDYSLKAGDESTRTALHSATQEAITGAVNRGYITPEQGVKAQRDYAIQSAVKGIEMLSPEDQIKALAPKANPKDADAAINYVIDNFEGTATVAHDGNKGTSKFGINQTANPDLDVSNLTKADAVKAYKSRYWDAIGADSLPDDMRLPAFDTAVNFGVPKAQDMIAQANGDPAKLVELRKAERARLIAADPETYGKYAKSWESRDNAIAGFEKTGTSVDFIPPDKRMELLKHATSAVKQEIELRDSDPMTYAQVKGITPNQPLNFGDPSSLSPQLQQRAQAAQDMQQHYGSPLKVMTNEEAKHFSSALDQMPTNNKLTYLKTFRDSLEDPRLYQASLQQIRPDSPVTAMAGAYLGIDKQLTTATHWFKPDDTITAEKVASNLVEGEALINPTKGGKQTDGTGKPFPMPGDNGVKGMRQTFNEYVGDAFRGSPVAADQAYQAYKAYYAAEASKSGDYTGELNPDLAPLAAKAVIGNVVEKGGKNVIAPWGMDETTFNDMAKIRFDDIKNAFGLKVNYDDVALENTGEPGKYRAVVGAGYLLDAGGKPLTINLGP